jgi:hypothetical protein
MFLKEKIILETISNSNGVSKNNSAFVMGKERILFIMWKISFCLRYTI